MRFFNNQYEQHIYEWKKEDFYSMKNILFPLNNVSLLVYAGGNAPSLKNQYQATLLKKRLIELFAFLSVFRSKHQPLKCVSGRK